MEERKLKELAQALPTPSYIFDTDMLKERLSWTAGNSVRQSCALR